MKKQTRSFGGKIKDFESPAEKAFENKHLRAYLKGWQQFRHGFDERHNPIWHLVKELWS